MNIRYCLLFVPLLALDTHAASPAWQAMQRGLGAYTEGDYATAATNFEAAATTAPKEKFDPAAAAFNRANAQLKAGQAADAAQTYAEALRTTDLGIQASAYHNRGNALLGVASEQEQQQKFKEAITSVEEAMTMFERSMMLSSTDRDPKINHEMAARKKTELEEKLKQQQEQQQQNQDQQKDDQKKDEQKQDQQDQQKKDNTSDEQNKQKQDQEKQDQQKQSDQQDQKSQEKDEPSQEEQQQAAEKPAEEMTPQEAALLLDAMRQQEQAQRERIMAQRLKSNAGRLVPVDKDW